VRTLGPDVVRVPDGEHDLVGTPRDSAEVRFGNRIGVQQIRLPVDFPESCGDGSALRIVGGVGIRDGFGLVGEQPGGLTSNSEMGLAEEFEWVEHITVVWDARQSVHVRDGLPMM
jgi:hypothetical protein